ncbi:MAG: CCA tRNA nucleotidyltransferase [Planctomycetota bacterium]|nr:CCA tRNA nucleotidyltransferase [Planctomycetota bacterium]
MLLKKESVSEAGLWVVRTLAKKGFRAYWAGGCVRDILLNRPLKEIDIATDAKPEDIATIFRKTIPVGAKFGVMVVVRSGYQFQVATFRADISYSNGRHPDSVLFVSEEEDVKRRDFTINGMLYDPLKDNLLDFVGGQEDLKKKIVRAIGDARERMKEDKLRMLRAIRFALQLDFTIEEKTWAAVKDLASEITTISGERIREEFAKIVETGKMERAAFMLDSSGLIDAIFPEISSLKMKDYDGRSDMRTHSLKLFSSLSSPTFVESLSALLHNCKTSPDRCESDALSVADRLRLSREERSRLLYLLLNQNALNEAANKRLAYLKRIFARREYPELVGLYEAKVKAGCGEQHSLEFVRRLYSQLTYEEIRPKQLIDGDDLTNAGFNPSPLFKRVLDAVYDEQLEGKIQTKEEALNLARRLFSEFSDESGADSA